jgi:predicted nucleic acid-binding protein
MRILIDTNAYSGFKRGNLDITEILAGADEIVMTPIVLGELRAGFKGGKREGDNLWIAAATLETGSILLSRDTHFDVVPGLLRR